MSDPTLSRRDFLKLARTALLTASGLIGLGGLLRFLSYQTEPPAPTEFDLGPAKNYAPGSRTLLPQVPAVLFRSEHRFHRPEPGLSASGVYGGEPAGRFCLPLSWLPLRLSGPPGSRSCRQIINCLAG